MSIETEWTIAVTEVPHNGLHFARTATPAQCSALAKLLGILECRSLACDLRVRALRQGRYRVAGRLTAQVTQACVVSLEPVAGDVSEAIDVEFWPRDQIRPAVEPNEALFDPDAPDDAEPIDLGQIDIGRLICECLTAGVDPYPRRPDAALTWTEKPEVQNSVHPFAQLAKLKKND